MKTLETDLLIIGSEGAGAMAAITAHDVAEDQEQRLVITVVTKGRIAKTGATLTGGADISVDSKSLNELGFENTDVNDNKETFFNDIIKGGKYINNQKLVEIFVDEAPARIKDLLDMGGGWEGIEKGKQYMQRRAGWASGHSYARGAYMRGPRLSHIFKEQITKRKIELIEYVMITDLLTNDHKVNGAVGLNILTGELYAFKTKSVIIATGGMLEVYPYSTGPVELTGDGQAIAFRAGAELIDIEFPMFIPGSFIWPPSIVGDLAPFLLAAGGGVHGWILNNQGYRFMEKWDPKNMERTTRDIVSIASMIEVMEGRGSPHGGVYYSIAHLPENLANYIRNHSLNIRNPKYLELASRGELHSYCPHSTKYDDFFQDLGTNGIEALAACHYSNGGIRINEKCETNIQGLFVAGEALGGMMGANRLSGNAFMEFLVWGHRAGRFAANYSLKINHSEINKNQISAMKEKILAPVEREDGTKPIKLRRQIQKLAWEKVGIVRNEKGLQEALKEIKRIWKEEIPQQFTKSKTKIYNREWFEALENENLLLCLEMTARAALIRKESRGAHYRSDYPKTDYPNWTRNIIIKKVDDQIDLSIKPAIITNLNPPNKIVRYGVVE